MYAIYSIYAGGGEWIEETMNNDQLEKLFTPDGRLIYYCYDFEDNVTKYNFEPESGRLTIGNDVVYVIRLTHNEMICIDWNDKENAIAKTVYHRIA